MWSADMSIERGIPQFTDSNGAGPRYISPFDLDSDSDMDLLVVRKVGVAYYELTGIGHDYSDPQNRGSHPRYVFEERHNVLPKLLEQGV